VRSRDLEFLDSDVYFKDMVTVAVVCFIWFLPIKTILIYLQNVLHNKYFVIKDVSRLTVNCTE
jgi:hypothetical protein